MSLSSKCSTYAAAEIGISWNKQLFNQFLIVWEVKYAIVLN